MLQFYRNTGEQSTMESSSSPFDTGRSGLRKSEQLAHSTYRDLFLYSTSLRRMKRAAVVQWQSPNVLQPWN